MKYNFDEIIPRRGTNCVKWDCSDDPEMLPLWVADMDFRVAPCIQQTMQRRLDHGVFGYVKVPESYYQSIIRWFSRRYGWTIQREEILYTIGVVPAIAAILQSITRPGDKVLLQTPVYNCFFSCLRNAGNVLVENPLVCRDRHYEIDFEDFEQKIIENAVKLYILCSPHNPVARVWSEQELKRVFDICQKHHVIIVSDEIHQDLVLGDHRHTTSLIVENGKYIDSIVMLTAASKTFNIAGLQNSFVVTASIELGEKLDDQLKYDALHFGNPFGFRAAEAAYRHGESWLKAFLKVIEENYQSLKMILSQDGRIHIYPLEGTYLCWVDLRECVAQDDIHHIVQDIAGIAVDYGEWFGDNGKGFIRINLATTPERIQTVANHLLNAIRD